MLKLISQGDMSRIKKPRISAGLAYPESTLSFAGARETRRLRTPESAIGHAQRSGPGTGCRWREHYADRALGLRGQARRAGRRRDAKVSRRPNDDAGQRYGLFVRQREHFGE